MENGCTCDGCGSVYKVDIIVPDLVWARITSQNADVETMLCGPCIALRIEASDKFDAYKLTPA